MSAPLPPGWEMSHDAQGRVYYINHVRLAPFLPPFAIGSGRLLGFDWILLRPRFFFRLCFCFGFISGPFLHVPGELHEIQ
jgi:hypothetical protein